MRRYNLYWLTAYGTWKSAGTVKIATDSFRVEGTEFPEGEDCLREVGVQILVWEALGREGAPETPYKSSPFRLKCKRRYKWEPVEG